MNANFNKSAYLTLKQELKDTAEEIRTTRFQHKEAQRSGLHRVAARLGWRLDSLSWDYRHKHIAMSEIRGKTRDQIEQPKEGNEPNEALIQEYKSQILSAEPERELCCAK